MGVGKSDLPEKDHQMNRTIEVTFSDGSNVKFADGWNYKINSPDAADCLKVFRDIETQIFPMAQIKSIRLVLPRVN